MYSCETLFPAHNQITIIKNPSAAEGRHNHIFFQLDCVKVGRCLAELGGGIRFFCPLIPLLFYRLIQLILFIQIKTASGISF